MEKKSTSKKATKRTVKNQEVTFAGKIARKSTFKASKWSRVPGTARKFKKEELEVIHSVRIFSATDKAGKEYWFIKVLFKEGKELYEVSFTPDLKLIDEAEHGDYIDPEKFMWYKLTDGEEVIERAYGVIISDDEDDDMPY